ncbi:MAG: hypothetical protein RL580_2085 [Pseudomonadota bacterium]|jgi:hypothetical protein
MAAIACIAVMLGHELLGSAKVLDPLHQVALPADVVWLHHFSWHVGSISLVATAAMFVLGGRNTEHLILATFGTAISTGFAILGIFLAVFGEAALWNTPAPYPWAPIAALGGTGLYFAHKGTHR